MQSSDCLREDSGSADLICGHFCFCNSIPIKAILALIPNPYLRQFDSDDGNYVIVWYGIFIFHGQYYYLFKRRKTIEMLTYILPMKSKHHITRVLLYHNNDLYTIIDQHRLDVID